MVKIKFEPFRLCVACRKKLKKKQLLRVTKLKNGVLSFDSNQRFSGRGVYVCCDENCFKILKKKRKLEKSLKCAVPDEIYFTLESVINEQRT